MTNWDILDALALLNVWIHNSSESRSLIVTDWVVYLLVPVFILLEGHFLLSASAHTFLFIKRKCISVNFATLRIIRLRILRIRFNRGSCSESLSRSITRVDRSSSIVRISIRIVTDIASSADCASHLVRGDHQTLHLARPHGIDWSNLTASIMPSLLLILLIPYLRQHLGILDLSIRCMVFMVMVMIVFTSMYMMSRALIGRVSRSFRMGKHFLHSFSCSSEAALTYIS